MKKYKPYSEYKPNSECLICASTFYAPPSIKAKGGGKFCSKKCMGKFKTGKKDPNLTHKFPKGSIPWNAGKGQWIKKPCKNCNTEIETLASQNQTFCSKVCANAFARITDRSKMTYGTLHYRVKQMYGTPSKCENCGTEESKKFEWANISGEYKLDRADWARLCCKCHRRYDFGVKNKIDLCV